MSTPDPAERLRQLVVSLRDVNERLEAALLERIREVAALQAKVRALEAPRPADQPAAAVCECCGGTGTHRMWNPDGPDTFTPCDQCTPDQQSESLAGKGPLHCVICGKLEQEHVDNGTGIRVCVVDEAAKPSGPETQ